MRKLAWLTIVAVVVLVPLLVACGAATTPPAEKTTPPAEKTTPPAEKTTPPAEKQITPTENKTAPSTGGIPAVPHTLVGRDDCLLCHKTGTAGPAIPTSHASYTNALCQTCHKPAS